MPSSFSSSRPKRRARYMDLLFCGAGSRSLGHTFESCCATLLLGMSLRTLSVANTDLKRICIVTAFTIYLISGNEIFKKRRELRAFNNNKDQHNWENFKTTQIAVTSEFNSSHPFTRVEDNFAGIPTSLDKAAKQPIVSEKSFDQYSVNISTPPKSARPSMPPRMMSSQSRKNRAALEANRAAWSYTKVALLFFVSLLITWVCLTTLLHVCLSDEYHRFPHLPTVSTRSLIQIRTMLPSPTLPPSSFPLWASGTRSSTLSPLVQP